jgi:hypothetical protein
MHLAKMSPNPSIEPTFQRPLRAPLARRSCQTLDNMPTYRWSCLSCGSPNEADAFQCRVCDCPGRATLALMQEHRSRFQGRGGVIGASAPALTAGRSFSAGHLGLALIWLLTIGYVPQRLR